ncbi:MAG: NAD-binding protein, partial [Peptostreptococcaceae bacterium]
MNIVIIGNGKVGRKLTEILSNDNHDIVIIDKSYNEINKIINNYDVKAVHGNGASYEIQKKAGVDKADILIAVTPSDEINLISCFISKKIGVNKSIALISNLEYYNQLEFIQNNFNIDFVVNPEKSVANNIVNLILLPSCLRLKPFLNNDISLVELDMNVNNKLVNRDISYINKKLKSNIIVYCIERGNQFLLPKKEFMLKEEDKIYLIGYNNDLKKLFKIIDAYEDEIKSVMIIGGGKLGVCLSNLLIGLDLRVKIIESDIQKCRFISSNVP